tara:strand:+ start:40312 stop:41385 length:1074 start_codon:yes stop_codon:yes gene_type:complete
MKLVSFFIFFIFLSCNYSPFNHNNKIDESDSIEYISELIDNDITNDSLYLERAYLNIKINRIQSAIIDLEKSLILDSNQGKIHYLIADLLLNQLKESNKNNLKYKDFLNRSKYHFNQALKYNIDSSKSLSKLGELSLYHGKVSDDDNLIARSISLFIESLSINELDYQSYNLLGYAYNQLGQIDSALYCFNRSIEINPTNEEGYLQIGNLFYSNMDSNAAFYYKKVLSINKDNRLALYNLGLLYHSIGEYSKSQNFYHKIIDLEISDNLYEDACYNLGIMFLEDLKDYNNAINYFIEVIRVNENHFLSLYKIAISFQSLGDVGNAENYYRRTLFVNPNYIPAKEKLEKLLLDNEKYK